MEPAGGVADAVVTNRRIHWRGALLGVGLAIAAGLLVLFAPAPAHADDGAPGLLGDVVSDVTGVVHDVVSPVAAPLPSLREAPVVGGLVGRIADRAPVGTVTTPVADRVDGLLGDAVGSLPVVGGILGDRPVGDLLSPVAGTVDGALGALVSAPGPMIPTLPSAFAPGAVADAVGAASGLASVFTALAPADPLGAIVAGAGNSPLGGFASVPGDSLPASAVTANGPPGGAAVAVLGAGLLLLLLAGRVRPHPFRMPLSPAFGTDSSPD